MVKCRCRQPGRRLRQKETQGIEASGQHSLPGDHMNKRNYQKELDKKLEELQKEGKVPTLFLHSCCAPCSSYVLEYLSRYFEITVFYYNPNIYPPSEYEERTSEQERLIREFNGEWEQETDRHPIHFVAGTYVPDDFYAAAKGSSRSRKAAQDVRSALNSASPRRRERQKPGTSISLRRRLRSAP